MEHSVLILLRFLMSKNVWNIQGESKRNCKSNIFLLPFVYGIFLLVSCIFKILHSRITLLSFTHVKNRNRIKCIMCVDRCKKQERLMFLCSLQSESWQQNNSLLWRCLIIATRTLPTQDYSSSQQETYFCFILHEYINMNKRTITWKDS